MFLIKNLFKNKSGFTLAEVLITLGIIGVVAVLTLPMLISNHQKRVTETQLKKFYSTWSQAFQKMIADDGVENLGDTSVFNSLRKTVSYGNGNSHEVGTLQCYSGWYTGTSSITYGDNQAFLANLGKYISFEQNDSNQTSITNGNSLYNKYCPKTLRTPDGATIIAYTFWANASTNTSCETRGGKICSSQGNLIVDLNGTKQPNIVGKDIFAFDISSSGALIPYGGKDYAELHSRSSNTSSYYWKSATSNDSKCTSTQTSYGCTGRIMENGWKIDY